jgi:NADH-quinone oxidoreductase subunit I
MYGSGLVKGLHVTLKRFLSKKVTGKYPEVEPKLPPRSRGSFDFDAEKCISCNICANVCPNGAIRVDSFQDAKGKKILEKYNMNLGYCLFCGQCVSACPKKALKFSTNFHLACYNEKDAVYSWRGTLNKKEYLPQQEAAADKDTQPKPAQGKQEV